jgi:hypothetical protein
MQRQICLSWPAVDQIHRRRRQQFGSLCDIPLQPPFAATDRLSCCPANVMADKKKSSTFCREKSLLEKRNHFDPADFSLDARFLGIGLTIAASTVFGPIAIAGTRPKPETPIIAPGNTLFSDGPTAPTAI